MSRSPLRLVLAAEEAAGVQVLRRLLALPEPPEVVAVATTPPAEAAKRPLVHEAARSLGLETWPAREVGRPELAGRLRGAGVDLLLNVHSLQLVAPEVVGAPRIGSFNLHPGPLPEYAGLNVPSWAVYRGERRHAVTLHWLDEGIDTGPVAWAEPFELGERDTGLAVAGACVRRGVPLVLRLVRAAADDPGSIPRLPQDLSRRRYFRAGPPAGGRLDWTRPAAELDRLWRAADYGPFPSPWPLRAELEGRRVTVTRLERTGETAAGPPGSVCGRRGEEALVACRDEVVAVRSAA